MQTNPETRASESTDCQTAAARSNCQPSLRKPRLAKIPVVRDINRIHRVPGRVVPDQYALRRQRIKKPGFALFPLSLLKQLHLFSAEQYTFAFHGKPLLTDDQHSAFFYTAGKTHSIIPSHDTGGQMTDSRNAINDLKERMGRSIIGQEEVVERLLLTLLCDGNVLVEGLPGLAKTRAVKSLARNLESEFSRIQFTPDLLPSDITGSEMYLGEDAVERFSFQPGPIFANIVLADEINRAPAKVQAALLEAMEERQVTVAGKTHELMPMFMVMATQNPIEQEGTYPLPEAQMDRFLMHVFITYPDDASEKSVIRLVRGESNADASASETGETSAIAQSAVFEARDEISRVVIPEPMEDYIVSLVAATRRPAEFSDDLARYIQVGVSPRGSIALDKVSRAHAWLHGRDSVTPDDIRTVINDCIRHRIILSYEAQADGVTTDDVITLLVKQVAVA